MNSEWTDDGKWGIDGQQILDYEARAMLGIVGRDSGVYRWHRGIPISNDAEKKRNESYKVREKRTG